MRKTKRARKKKVYYATVGGVIVGRVSAVTKSAARKKIAKAVKLKSR